MNSPCFSEGSKVIHTYELRSQFSRTYIAVSCFFHGQIQSQKGLDTLKTYCYLYYYQVDLSQVDPFLSQPYSRAVKLMNHSLFDKSTKFGCRFLYPKKIQIWSHHRFGPRGLWQPSLKMTAQQYQYFTAKNYFTRKVPSLAQRQIYGPYKD